MVINIFVMFWQKAAIPKFVHISSFHINKPWQGVLDPYSDISMLSNILRFIRIWLRIYFIYLILFAEIIKSDGQYEKIYFYNKSYVMKIFFLLPTWNCLQNENYVSFNNGISWKWFKNQWYISICIVPCLI